MIEAGRVILPNRTSTGLKHFTDECEEFPNGEFDDVVDSMSQFLLNEKGKATGDYKSIKHVTEKRHMQENIKNI